MIKKMLHILHKLLRRITAIKPRAILQFITVLILMLLDRRHGRKILIIFIEELGFIQYILPIVEALKKKNSRISYYIATDHISHKSELAPFNVPGSKVFYPSLAHRMWLTDVFLSASVYGKGHENAIRINVSHNQPVKLESYPRSELVKYNVHFLTGPLHREQYENMLRKQGLEKENIKLLDIGYPKSDELLSGAYNRNEILRGMGLDPEIPVVLYAPAWDPGASLRSFGEEIIEKLLDMKNISVIVKLHPVSYTPGNSKSFDFYTGGVDWVERFSQFEKLPNFRHVKDFLIDPLLISSDVMVTDISSVALEFIMLDRPVIYLDCPEYFEKTLKMPGWDADPDYVRNDPKANAGRHVGVVVEDLSKLTEAVQKSLDNPGKLSKKRKQLAANLLYNQGKGAEAAANAILELLKGQNP
ncbi:CDP-glycerol glycerophosphotransferase family protein [Chloroflexota bacterium]